MTLAPIDASNALAVTDYLTKARDWLATCVEMTGPEQIAAAKAEIATAAEATKQLGLSKEIQLDAKEMVRRAEYALGKAIRKGQAEGKIRNQHDANSGTWTEGKERRSPDPTTPGGPKVYDLLPSGSDRGHHAALDGVSDEDFDAALDEAKAEGNLSRANVARKAREGCSKPAPKPAPRRALTDQFFDAAYDLTKVTVAPSFATGAAS